jgi:3-hydroxybutyryl-CoA dehydrogenase
MQNYQSPLRNFDIGHDCGDCMKPRTSWQGLTAAVIGSGTMGRGIVQVLATAGLDVLVHDREQAAARSAVEFVSNMLDRAAAKGAMSADDARRAGSRIRVVDSLAGLAGASLVVEAIVEALAPKQSLFAELEGIVADDAILATNTSSLPVTAIASGCRLPQRVVGLHFFNPVPLMKVAEVIPGLRTDADAVASMRTLLGEIGHRAIVCRDAPGFLINHAGRGLLTEGLRIVEEQVAAETDVDRVMREAAGFRMGPFELLDLTGLDVSLPVLELIYAQFHQEPRYRPSHQPAVRVAGGLFGRKSGEGFYRYADGARQEPVEAGPGDEAVPPLWVHPEARGPLAPILGRLERAGHVVGHAAEAPPGAAILIAPWGEDCTTAAVRLGLDARRTVAVDPLFPESRRLTLMATPVTDPSLTAGVRRAALEAGIKATAIHDSPGFIAQRVLATIVNIGCEIAQMRIAEPADIDEGVRLGLGYPAGPLTLGDRIGTGRVVTILEAMQACYGDPRYRPSVWLRRRAMLGVPLTTEEA